MEELENELLYKYGTGFIPLKEINRYFNKMYQMGIISQSDSVFHKPMKFYELKNISDKFKMNHEIMNTESGNEKDETFLTAIQRDNTKIKEEAESTLSWSSGKNINQKNLKTREILLEKCIKHKAKESLSDNNNLEKIEMIEELYRVYMEYKDKRPTRNKKKEHSILYSLITLGFVSTFFTSSFITYWYLNKPL